MKEVGTVVTRMMVEVDLSVIGEPGRTDRTQALNNGLDILRHVPTRRNSASEDS